MPTATECYIEGYVVLLSLFLSLFVSSLLFALGSHVQPWIFPTACVVSVLGGHVWLCKRAASPGRALLRYYIVMSLLLFTAIFTAACIYDNSSDGNLYHQGTVIALLGGWNPFAGSEGIEVLWIKHYAKGIETIAATIVACTGRLESGKAVNLLLALSTLLFTAAFMRREFPALSRIKVLWLALVMAMCPIVLRQLYVYYVDYAMYCFLLLTVLSLVQIYRQPTDYMAWSILVMVVLMAPTVKFTVAFYEYVALAVAVVWFFCVRRKRLAGRLAVLSVLLLLVGMCGLGYHPYVTNTAGWGNPFYPLIGSSVDIMSSNTPQLYEGSGRIVNFIKSLFYTYDGAAVWIPGVTDSLNDYVIAFDRRIAGFGPFFVYILVGSVVLFVLCRKQLLPEKARPMAILAVLLFLGCFFFEQAWWMRYVPFLWAVPVVLLLCTEYVHLAKWQRIFRGLLYLLMAATMAMAVASAAIGALSVTGRFNAICRSVSPDSTVNVYVQSMDSFLYKLSENNVTYELLDTNESPDTTLRRLPLLEDWVVFYLDEETYSRISRPDFLDIVTRNKGE